MRLARLPSWVRNRADHVIEMDSGTRGYAMDRHAPWGIALPVLAFLSIVLTACSPESDVPIQTVDSSETISDEALELLASNTIQEKDVYYFGFDLRQSPQEDAAQYIPFLNYLSRETGLKFKLYFTPKNSTSADELGRNNTQFAAMGATSYLYARERYGAISLVRGINHEGRAEYQSVFVTQPDSPISSLTDIAGQRLAFGSRDSTQGHLIPRIMLTKAGIDLDDLGFFAYTGSHQNCAEAVVSRSVDVCGMQDQLAARLAEDGALKIFHRSAFYPSSGISANRTVPEGVVQKVQEALLAFEPDGAHRVGLYNWDQTEMPGGFIAASDEDYAELFRWSVELGLLDSSKAPP